MLHCLSFLLCLPPLPVDMTLHAVPASSISLGSITVAIMFQLLCRLLALHGKVAPGEEIQILRPDDMQLVTAGASSLMRGWTDAECPCCRHSCLTVKQLLCYWGCIKLRHQVSPAPRVVIPLIETQALYVSLANSAILDVHLSRLVTGFQVCSTWAKDKYFVPHCSSLPDSISHGSRNWAGLPREKMMAITQRCYTAN